MVENSSTILKQDSPLKQVIAIRTYKDICGWACQTHGQGFQPLSGAHRPEASERHYAH